MPEDPKKVFKKIRSDQAERERIQREREIARQQSRRRGQTPPEAENEPESARWVRANMEWEDYPGLWCPKFTSYSDYSGSFVDKANAQALKEAFPELFEEGHGGHGTVWTGIPEDKRLTIPEDDYERLRDMIHGLEDYPVIDDELLSNLEWKAKEEFWEEYGRDGIREALIEKFSGAEPEEGTDQHPNDPDAQIAVLLQTNEFWDTMAREHEWFSDMEPEEGMGIAFREKRAVRGVGRDEIVNENAVENFKREYFIGHGLEQFMKLLQDHGLETNADNATRIFMALEKKYEAWDVDKRIHSGIRNDDGTMPELKAEDHIDIRYDALQDMADGVSHGDVDAAERARWANDPRQQKLPGFESCAHQLVAAVLEEAINIRPSEQAFDWNGLPTVAGVNDAGDEFECLGAFDGDKLVGSVIYQNAGDMLWLEHVYVVEPYRRRGIAEDLVRSAMAANPGLPLEGNYRSAEMAALVRKLGGIVSEAEEPKGVWTAIRGKQRTTTHVHIVARRWFSRNFGNTYFSADIYVNGELVHQIPYAYGHGDHYEEEAFQWLEDHNYIPKRKHSPNGGQAAPWRWAEKNNIRLSREVYDVRRRRDL